jgi:molybdopterin/thiamine biosynthesis adenylyltransferase
MAGTTRYIRQTIFPPLGEAGQARLAAATVVVVGCGATGTAISNLLARMGVGQLRIIDRDFIELNNLQRQTLFDEDDIAANIPKAEAAAHKLRVVNRDIDIEAVVTDVNAGNVLTLVADATVVMDGTDNFSTRYLLNDACTKLGLPWVYTGVLASYGMTATLIPEGAVAKLPGARNATGCLRCLLGDMPAPGTTPTCDTAGVIGPAVAAITAVAAAEAMKLIVGSGELNPGLVHMDVWSNEYEAFAAGGRNGDCLTCVQHRFAYLDAQRGTTTTTLCGRNAVQVVVKSDHAVDLGRVAAQLADVAEQVDRNEYLLRARVDGYEFTIFPDNRAIIKGTEDESLAKTLFARYIGA